MANRVRHVSNTSRVIDDERNSVSSRVERTTAVQSSTSAGNGALGADTGAKPDRLSRMMDSTEILITYACRNAVKPVDIEESNFKGVIEDLLIQREAYKRNTMDPKMEAAFLENFRRLTRALQPVTVGSIQDSVWEKGMPYTCLLFRTWPISRADAAISRFTILSVLALIALLLVQIFWVFGYTLIEQINDLSQPVVEKAPALSNPSDKTATTGASPNASNEVTRTDIGPSPGEKATGPGKTLRTADEVNKTTPVTTKAEPLPAEGSIELKKLNRQVQRSAAFDLLRKWSFTAKLTDDRKDPMVVLSENNSILISSASAVNIIDRYVLPLLYGLMGACTYVLREIVREMRTRVFRAESEISYWVRIFLGMLAGLAIGWLFRSNMSLVGDTAKESNELISRLGPSALSFVAGYSVELLFSAMDRIIVAFGSTSQQSKS